MRQNHEMALTRAAGFGILNMLGGHWGRPFSLRKDPDKMITLGQLFHLPTKGYRLFLISNIILTSLS